jgi:hypothetical protein
MVAALASPYAVWAAALESTLSRSDALPGVRDAVDAFINCARGEKTDSLGVPYKDSEHRPDDPGAYKFCGAIVHWDAQSAKDMRECLDKRSFGEDVDRLPSRSHGAKAYDVQYTCGTFWLVLEVESQGANNKVVRMDWADMP